MKELMQPVPFVVRAWTEEIPFHKTGADTYENDAYRLKVTVHTTTYPTTGAIRQTNTIENCGKDPVVLSGFSSAFIHTCRGKIGVDRNRWQAEGQWNFFSPEQCVLVPATIHPWERETYTISSVGSWSTGVFYPLTIVLGEDGYAYYMEIEGAHNWQLTHMVTGSMTSPAFALEGTAAHEENGGWHYTLLPGESYTTEPAVFGRVKGGYEEVCAELVAYKRAVSLTHHANDTIPVVFNDYMNCLWGAPSDKKLLPLIDAAADVGCEVFCIDAGWHKNASPGTYGAAGDWIVADERFGDEGLAGIFTHMRERGLTPGVWFEWDTVNASAAAHDLDDDCLLKRYGKPFPRAFFNFQNEKVRAHLTARVDALYSMGVRYIKNDYNQTTGIGCDCGDLAPAEGLIRNYHAFCDFVDRLRAKYPDLVIENCGSGACRADNGTLAHFHLQSTSDQEFYYWYPSVIIGSMAHFAPEKAGIWSYPMAVPFDRREDFAPDKAWYDEMASGEATIFNLVNGMCGTLYQSGRIDLADEKNRALVREGIAAYKRMRADIVTSHPIVPTAPENVRIGTYGNAAAGLETADRTKAYLAVWRIGSESDTVCVDLTKYGCTKAQAWYPAECDYSFADGILTVKLPEKFSARMILLTK